MPIYREHGLDVRIVRIFNTYGPWMRPNDGRVISNFVTQALGEKDLTIYGDGSQTRSFCYVSDTVEGITRLLFADGDQMPGGAEEIHRPVNMGNPRESKVIDIARLVLEMTGSRSQIKFLPLPTDDPKVRRPDISRARRLLGWEPQVSLEDGLDKTIAFFRSA